VDNLETKSAMLSRANQLKKARENFFLGNSMESSADAKTASAEKTDSLKPADGKKVRNL